MAIETKTVITCNAWDIEELINKYFPSQKNEFSIVAHQELSNGVSWTCNINEDDIMVTSWVDAVVEAHQGKFYFSLHAILSFLVKIGELELGDYVVDCSW